MSSGVTSAPEVVSVRIEDVKGISYNIPRIMEHAMTIVNCAPFVGLQNLLALKLKVPLAGGLKIRSICRVCFGIRIMGNRVHS